MREHTEHSGAHSAVKAARTAVIREATFDDYERVSTLEDRFGLRSKPLQEWTHLWTANPVYQRLDGWPLGWVLEASAGDLAGYIGNLPLRYEFDGRTILTATARAWAVEPAYRNYAIPLLNRYFDQPRVGLFLNTTVNALSGAPFTALDSTPVPVGRWDRAGFWVADYGAFARHALALRAPAVSGLLGWPASLALRARGAAARLPAPRVEIESQADFGPSFDVFWGALRQAKRRVLLADRSRAMLAWHFGPALAAGGLWIATAGGARGMTAYAVFTRRDHEGVTRMRLADYQSLDAAEPTLDEFLRWALDRCRAARLQVLEVVGRTRRAPFQRRLPHWCFYYRTHDPVLARELRATNVWEPSSYDGDASL